MKTATSVLILTQPIDEEVEEKQDSHPHCIWCDENDPGDEFGSHGICTDHAAALLSAHRERRARA